MTNDLDQYEAYYGAKLWNLLPAVYRSLDTTQPNVNGPLRELVNRIGTQAATLRRSLDRLWEDQSIETCDDWVIAYIGSLLATNLVANLDAPSQRLDVAKTIHYRRRKGTLGVLEEIAFNITGWNARVVEFFRRLGRTRHSLDPALGLRSAANPNVAALQLAEGLTGPLTQTSIGGLADLRNIPGALKTDSAFDEFFHTADFRQGQGRMGWYNIPRVGVFLWRLISFPAGLTTPVPVANRKGWHTFDPTGRDIPLFAAARATQAYADNWVSPVEAQLPTPISQALWNEQLAPPASPSSPPDLLAPPVPLYPDSLAVYEAPINVPPVPDGLQPLDVSYLIVCPETGRFHVAATGPTYLASYHYGFPSQIGAGPYDRRIGRAAPAQPDPQKQVAGGGNALNVAGVFPTTTGSVILGDSLTYTAFPEVKVDGQVALAADVRQRPVLRLPPKAGGWQEIHFTGTGKLNCLVLAGLLISGADVVLRGQFDCVTITCCTLDPGTSAPPPLPHTSPPSSLFALAADKRELVPSRLWIEGSVGTLTVARSITGPIGTRGNGTVETLNLSDSIVQAIPTIQAPAGVSYSVGLIDAALAFTDGDVNLSRCTVLGRIVVHRLQASECIVQDVVQVDDTQNGCVRFSAWAEGSMLPRQYECVRIRARADLFTSTRFGQPGYGQLLPTVDAAILPSTGPAPPAPPTIAAGAQDGSEMGAFARDKNPLKERGLLLKFQEFMPAGLVPVLSYVT